MATYTIVEDGFITEPYASQYSFNSIEGQNTLRQINGNKYGCIVTISASGKPDKTFYHEVENWGYEEPNIGIKSESLPDSDTLNFWLQKLADDYEAS